MLTLGLVSVSFRPHPPEEIVQACVRAKLGSIEWGGDVHVPHGNLEQAEAVAKLTTNHGLTVAAYGSYYRAGYSANEGLPFQRVLDTALALDAPVIRIWAGRQGSAATTPALRRTIVDDLTACAEAAGQHRRQIALEFHADTLADEADETVRLLQEINHPALRSYWQPRHGEDTAGALAGLRSLSEWLSHVHVFEWWPTHRERHSLGHGRVRWRAFLRQAATTSGDRHALLEFMPHDRLDELSIEAATLHSIVRDLDASGVNGSAATPG